MIFVVDSSVALKWFVDEPNHEFAKRLILDADRLVAPEWAYAEVSNVLWRKVRFGELAIDQARAAIVEIPLHVELLAAETRLMNLALDIAQQLEHSIYDCVFLAMALSIEGGVLATDDGRFAKKAVASGFADKVRMLGDAPILFALEEPRLAEFSRLYKAYRYTREFVESKVGKPLGESGLISINATDILPALDSPVYRSLTNDIAGLRPQEAASLIATCWLGRGYDGSDYEKLIQQAAHLAAEPSKHAAYIVSLLGYLEKGIAASREPRV